MPRALFYSPLRVATFVVVLSVALTFALLPIDSAQHFPEGGERARDPVLATADLRFESDLLTAEARDMAADAVAPLLTFDAGVRTAQVAGLANYLDAASALRDNPDLSGSERVTALADLPDRHVSPRVQVLILGLSDSSWASVTARAIPLLTEVLTQNITEDDVDRVQKEVEARVDAGLSSLLAEIVVELVAPLVQPNVGVDEEATAQARDEARATPAPVTRTITKGDVVVPADETVTPLALEVLDRLPRDGGGIPGDDLMAALILAVVSAGVLGVYLLLAAPSGAASDRRLLLVGVLLVGMVALARWYFPAVLPEEQSKYLDLAVPLGIAAVLIAALLERSLAVIVAVLVGVLAGAAAMIHPDYGAGEAPVGAQALRPMAVFIFSGIAGVFATQRVERITQYGVTGLVVGVTVFLSGLAFWLLDPVRSSDDLAWLALVASIVAVATGILAVGAFSFLGLVFGITTRLQLLELAQLTQPLMRRLQEEAPGTFHHSLLVATMAERAATQIGADALLVRVGAYHHDIGKLSKPHMYIENQAEGANPHDALDPLESAQVIRDHVRWGMELGRRQRLPASVRAFIPEHHGSRMVTYFYRKAAQTTPTVDPAHFRYEGPKPQTRETAVVMLADSCEAVVRSSRQRDVATIDRLVDAVLQERLTEQQFDECDLTMQQFRMVAESFKVTLRGVYHPRIGYPDPSAAVAVPVTAAPAPVGDAPVDGSALPPLSGRRPDSPPSR